MSKGYAFGFLIVLLVLGLGFYVAYTGFMSSRETSRAQSAALYATETARAGSAPTRPPTSTPSPTIITLPTPVAGITATLTAMMPAVMTEEVAGGESPAPPPTEEPAPIPTQPQPVPPTDTLPAPTRPPTPAPVPAYQFRLASPPTADPTYQNCCYIYGTVRDAAGRGLEGILVQAFNEWNTLPPAATKGGGELGQYNIPIGHDLVTWYIVVVDAAGKQISSQVQIQFDPSVANGHRVDWQRTY